MAAGGSQIAAERILRLKGVGQTTSEAGVVLLVCE